MERLSHSRVLECYYSPQALGVNANFDEEEGDTGDEVAQSLVRNDALVYGVANGHLNDLCRALGSGELQDHPVT